MLKDVISSHGVMILEGCHGADGLGLNTQGHFFYHWLNWMFVKNCQVDFNLNRYFYGKPQLFLLVLVTLLHNGTLSFPSEIQLYAFVVFIN